MSDSAPPLSRGEGRSVRRRTRTFRPNYLSFAGTYQCNLACPHCCVPIEWPDRLDIGVALRFLEQAAAQGIGILALTGGEPFLYADFVHKVCRRAAQLGFRFDKIMTNGVWHEDVGQLEEVLGKLARGYTGKLGLSVDKFHGLGRSDTETQRRGDTGYAHGRRPVGALREPVPASRSLEKLVEFCRTARRVFGRDNIISISYASRHPRQGLEPVQRLALALAGHIDWSELLGRHLLVTPDLTIPLNWNHLAPVERAEKLGDGWDGVWFTEDYCEGPGQALIVNPRGEVKPCCGFASDLDQLTIGNIHHDSVAQIIRRARKHPYVGKLFRQGLTAIRGEILARDPNALPGATSNHCFFCWYILTRGLAADLPGGGGQVGNWTGTRPNRDGELIQLGVRQGR